jgi:hypothetical protein
MPPLSPIAVPAVCEAIESVTTQSERCIEWSREPHSHHGTGTRTASRALGMRRATQRWDVLVSSPTSRLARYMRDRLGPQNWL